jgi:Response regulator containing a CheY-like receiver domain and an HTH DNA-binding domain
MTESDIKICIVEDDPEFQDWLAEELADEKRFVLTGRFDIAEQALANIPLLKPDIVLMDLGLEKSDIGGIECMLRLKLVSPELKFLVITAHGGDDKVFEALKVGAGAYILKSDVSDKLRQVVLDFYNGGAPMSAQIAQKIIASFHKPAADIALVQQLTSREQEILYYLSQGFLYKEIADKLTNENEPSKKLAEGTVKKHAHNIYQKLQVNNRTEAIRKYLSR